MTQSTVSFMWTTTPRVRSPVLIPKMGKQGVVSTTCRVPFYLILLASKAFPTSASFSGKNVHEIIPRLCSRRPSPHHREALSRGQSPEASSTASSLVPVRARNLQRKPKKRVTVRGTGRQGLRAGGGWHQSQSEALEGRNCIKG